ncbi:MAG: cell division protein FtsN [Bacteroidia bacterium]
MFFKGYLPEPPEQKPVPDTTQSPSAEELADDSEIVAGESTDRRFDFFTVLPEMEVVVPDQELSRNAQPDNDQSITDGDGSYILQIASFKNSKDAEQMKARLALLGNVANIQVVTINGATWHRVRIGPINGARRTDELRRKLQDSGIETLVMKAST